MTSPGVLAGLHEFLIRTSVLDELSGPVCDELLEQQGSAQTLAKLAENSASCSSRSTRHTGPIGGSGCSVSRCAASSGVSSRTSSGVCRAWASAWHLGHGEGTSIRRSSTRSPRAIRSDRHSLWANIVSYLAHGRRDDDRAVARQLQPRDDRRIGVTRAVRRPQRAQQRGHQRGVSSSLYQAAQASKVGRGRRGQRRNGSPATGLAVIETLLARNRTRAMREAALRCVRARGRRQ